MRILSTILTVLLVSAMVFFVWYGVTQNISTPVRVTFFVISALTLIPTVLSIISFIEDEVRFEGIGISFLNVLLWSVVLGRLCSIIERWTTITIPNRIIIVAALGILFGLLGVFQLVVVCSIDDRC